LNPRMYKAKLKGMTLPVAKMIPQTKEAIS